MLRGFRGYARPPGLGALPPGAVPNNVMVNAQTMQQRGSIPNDEDRRFWFTYQTPNIATIAAAAAATNVIQFDNDSVFEWIKTTVVADIAGAVQTASSLVIPLATLQIQDTGTGSYYSNAAIPLAACAGDARLPFVLPAPQFIQPNASLQFTWANYSAATTYANLRVQLQGFKLKL